MDLTAPERVRLERRPEASEAVACRYPTVSQLAKDRSDAEVAEVRRWGVTASFVGNSPSRFCEVRFDGLGR